MFGHHESPPVTLPVLCQAAVERSEISWVQSGNLAMDIVVDVFMSLDTAGGRLLDAVTVTSLWKGSSGILLMGDDPPSKQDVLQSYYMHSFVESSYVV